MGENVARLSGISRNLSAFLDMIAVSEGTAGKGDDGYNVIVGFTTFHDYSKHPKILVRLKPGLKSTAAGRYQVLYKYAIAYQKMLGLKDFSPESQDRIAIQMIREQRGLEDVEAGRIRAAIAKCANIWASFPGAGYGQHENRLDRLLVAFKNAQRDTA